LSTTGSKKQQHHLLVVGCLVEASSCAFCVVQSTENGSLIYTHRRRRWCWHPTVFQRCKEDSTFQVRKTRRRLSHAAASLSSYFLLSVSFLSFREPWFHVTLFIVGGMIANYIPKHEKRLVEDINQMRADRGLPPMVGTNAWIKYKVPEGEEPLKQR
jgi:hypothetical protein